MAVAHVGERAGSRRSSGPDLGVVGLDGVLRSLVALHPDGSGLPGAPLCCTGMCCAVVGEVRARHVDHVASGGVVSDRAGGPDPEFETVLARRLAERYLRVVTDHANRAGVPQVWQLLLDPPPASPARLALAAVHALRDHDLTLAFVGAATLLGRAPGPRERDAHRRVAALLGDCARELPDHTDDPADATAAARLDDPAARDAAWRRAVHLWTLRGRPTEADAARRALDREVRVDAARLLVGA